MIHRFIPAERQAAERMDIPLIEGARRVDAEAMRREVEEHPEVLAEAAQAIREEGVGLSLDGAR